jgi:hypothetical protein
VKHSGFGVPRSLMEKLLSLHSQPCPIAFTKSTFWEVLPKNKLLEIRNLFSETPYTCHQPPISLPYPPISGTYPEHRLKYVPNMCQKHLKKRFGKIGHVSITIPTLSQLRPGPYCQTDYLGCSLSIHNRVPKRFPKSLFWEFSQETSVLGKCQKVKKM